MIQWRWWVLSIWLVGIVASAWVYVSNFRIDNSVSIWFLSEDPELESYRDHLADFGEHEWTYVWLQTESIYNPGFLDDLTRLSDRIESLDNVSRVTGLPNAGTFQFGLLGIPEYKLFDSSTLEQSVKGNPLWEGRFVPKGSDQFTILAIENDNKIDVIEPYRIQLLNEIREVLADYDSVQNFGIAGTTVINAELNRAAKRDMFIYYSLITGFVVIGGWLTLRRVRDVAVLGAVVLGAVLPVMGAIGTLNMPFNLITVMLPTILVTVSVSFLIHFINEFHTLRRNHPDTSTALSLTFHQLLKPGLWTTLTTGIGFSSLMLSPVAPIKQVGLFATLGILLSWLNTITIAPALLSLFWPSTSGEKEAKEEKGSPLINWLKKPHSALALILFTTLLAGILGLIRLSADTDYVKFFRPGNPIRNSYAQLDEIGMAGGYLTVTLNHPEDTELADYDRHQGMRDFANSLKSLPRVMDVRSVDTWMSEIASQLGVRNSTVITTLLRLFEGGKLGPTHVFLSEDHHRQQLLVMTDYLSTQDINQFRDELAILAKDYPPEWEISLTGTNVLWANMDAHVIQTQVYSIAITAAALLILLPIALRSLFLGLAGFLVSFVPVLCTLGLMGWLGLPVNIATCLLGGVVIGLAVDDTIYFLLRFRDGTKNGLSVDESLKQATQTTGRAMIKTSLILTGGFLTMAASDFMPSVYFGIFFAFSILVALLCDLIVLPFFLRTTNGHK